MRLWRWIAATTWACPFSPSSLITVSTATAGDGRRHLAVRSITAAQENLMSHPQDPAANSSWPSNKHGMRKCAIWKWRLITCLSLNRKILILGKLNICMQEQGYIWKLFISDVSVVQWGTGKKKKKKNQIWQTVLCVELATVATVTVWLTAVWFGFSSCAPVRECLCKNVRVWMHAHIWGWKTIKWWDDRRNESSGGISSAQK